MITPACNVTSALHYAESFPSLSVNWVAVSSHDEALGPEGNLHRGSGSVVFVLDEFPKNLGRTVTECKSGQRRFTDQKFELRILG
jgi:hypothetical protein